MPFRRGLILTDVKAQAQQGNGDAVGLPVQATL